MKSPTAYIYTAAVEHKIGHNLAARVLYSGSHSTNLVGNGNQAGHVSYGVDINAQPGDLLTKPPGSAPTRLNPSFGSIAYADNDRVANYNGITFDLRGRGKRHVLRRVLHAIELEGRCRQLPDGDQSASVLWAVAVGRAESILGDGDLRGSGHE